MAKRFLGMSDREMYRAIEADSGAPLPVDYDESVKAIIRRQCEDELKALPGLVDMLERLQLPYCVASSSTMEMLNFKLEVTGIAKYFEGRVFSADAVANGKPAPDLFLHAARHMAMDSKDCVVIEDSVNGVLAAAAAGMRAIGYLGASHLSHSYARPLREAGASNVVIHFAELPSLLPRAFGPASLD